MKRNELRYQVEGRAETFTLAQLLNADADAAPTADEEAAIAGLLRVGESVAIDAGFGETWNVRRIA